jgi:hypothetical protein
VVKLASLEVGRQEVPLQSFPTLVEKADNQDKSTHQNTDEEVQNTCLAFDNLNHDVN